MLPNDLKPGDSFLARSLTEPWLFEEEIIEKSFGDGYYTLKSRRSVNEIFSNKNPGKDSIANRTVKILRKQPSKTLKYSKKFFKITTLVSVLATIGYAISKLTEINILS